MPNSQKGFALILILLIVTVIAAIGGGYYFLKIKPPSQAQKACTMEAKICPDGSSVGRIGTNCEFSPCPTVTQTNIEEKDCGGFAGETGQMACPTGYYCKYPRPMYPDASGKCTKNVIKN